MGDPILATNNAVVKRGWMKKQGGLVKNWQHRWFVLKGQKLMYFTKDDECKMLGTIDLDGTKLEEIPFTRDEPDKFLFNIALVRGGKMGGNHDSYLICASSDQERTEWVSALRRAIYGHVGGGVFGGSLQGIMAYDREHYGCKVPHVVQQCVDIIREDGLLVEGIFRKNGSVGQVKELRRRYDEGQRPNLRVEHIDIHTTASLLKLYFRELPESVIPFEHFESFLSLATSFRYNSNHDATFQSLKGLILQIPKDSLHLLDYLTGFLNEISKHQNMNKMTEKNISLVFGTNILRSEDNSPEFQMATQNLTTHVVLALVKWHDLLFVGDENKETVKVDDRDFEDLVKLSEITTDETSSIESASLHEPAVVDDLVDIAAPNSVSDSVPARRPPPPIPPRSSDVPNMETSTANNDTEPERRELLAADSIQAAPTPSPRSTSDVCRRALSRRRSERPGGFVDSHKNPAQDQELPVKNSESVVKRPATESNGLNHNPVTQNPMGISLDVSDLPTKVDDLQALAISLKLQLKETQEQCDKMTREYQRDVGSLRMALNQECQAKDEAVLRIMELTKRLADYHQQFGSIAHDS